MAAPPHAGHVDTQETITRITWRHHHIDDPRRSELGTEPSNVLDYLVRRSVGLPPWVAANDPATPSGHERLIAPGFLGAGHQFGARSPSRRSRPSSTLMPASSGTRTYR